MQIFHQKQPLTEFLEPYIVKKRTVGLVPTMGALHEGHLSLVKHALQDNDLVIVSIFVNPTQFNNEEDLLQYPRTLQKDIDTLKSLGENLIIFNPRVEEMYPENENPRSSQFDFDGLETLMEGSYRPGHFNGVGTIVKKLLETVTPQNAYFGEKDYQQLLIVKKLVRKYNFPVTVIGCPILREANGLAMSSRNQRLPDDVRKKASIIYKTLLLVKEMFVIQTASQIKEQVAASFKTKNDFTLEYLEIAETDSLKSAEQKEEGKTYRAFIAVYAGNVRLIDNIEL
ncbi:pantoate--beta-alanine ligase [Ascidiimonas aurantiaca]|uniref:pantoate--beta-alanine ligase n=1 Tax=Ascidiimonas aurantiaca TaxID=1685432 RepID=UPI0030EECF33